MKINVKMNKYFMKENNTDWNNAHFLCTKFMRFFVIQFDSDIQIRNEKLFENC